MMGNMLGIEEHTENLMKADREIKGNIMGTHWEPRKMKNNPSLSFPAPQKNLK
jgi:hypothetical protein